MNSISTGYLLYYIEWEWITDFLSFIYSSHMWAFVLTFFQKFWCNMTVITHSSIYNASHDDKLYSDLHITSSMSLLDKHFCKLIYCQITCTQRRFKHTGTYIQSYLFSQLNPLQIVFLPSSWLVYCKSHQQVCFHRRYH